MPDHDFMTSRPPVKRSGGGRRLLLGALLLAALGGIGAAGWLVWDGQLHVDMDSRGITLESTADEPSPAPSASPAPLRAITAAPEALDQRMTALGQRLDALAARADAAAGNVAQAEGLLVALAVRRAVERGQPLGYLEQQLAQRFGAEQPAAVAQLTEIGQKPVTRDQLLEQFDLLAPALAGSARGTGGWQRIRRELTELFVIRREVPGARAPADRLAQARLMVRAGRFEEAANLVAGLPGANAAGAWLAEVKRLAAAERALDAIEAAALSRPPLVDAAAGLPAMVGAAAALPDAAAGAQPAPVPAAAPSAPQAPVADQPMF